MDIPGPSRQKEPQTERGFSFLIRYALFLMIFFLLGLALVIAMSGKIDEGVVTLIQIAFTAFALYVLWDIALLVKNVDFGGKPVMLTPKGIITTIPFILVLFLVLTPDIRTIEPSMMAAVSLIYLASAILSELAYRTVSGRY